MNIEEKTQNKITARLFTVQRAYRVIEFPNIYCTRFSTRCLNVCIRNYTYYEF